jgi:hypothetical protein
MRQRRCIALPKVGMAGMAQMLIRREHSVLEFRVESTHYILRSLGSIAERMIFCFLVSVTTREILKVPEGSRR